MESARQLNVGCGPFARPGWVNLDLVAYPGVDVVHDLRNLPWPFAENRFEEIVCHHVLEHLDDFHATVRELHRIGKPGAVIEVLAPYFFSTKYAGDPSHRIPFSYRTFDAYTPPRKVRPWNRWRLVHATNFGAGFLFETLEKRYVFDRNRWLRWFGFFHNLWPEFYERFFPALLPPMEVLFRLRVVK